MTEHIPKTKELLETPYNQDFWLWISNTLRDYKYQDIMSLFDIVNRLWKTCDYDLMSTLLHLAYKKDYFEFANIILQTLSDRISLGGIPCRSWGWIFKYYK